MREREITKPGSNGLEMAEIAGRIFEEGAAVDAIRYSGPKGHPFP